MRKVRQHLVSEGTWILLLSMTFLYVPAFHWPSGFFRLNPLGFNFLILCFFFNFLILKKRLDVRLQKTRSCHLFVLQVENNSLSVQFYRVGVYFNGIQIFIQFFLFLLVVSTDDQVISQILNEIELCLFLLLFPPLRWENSLESVWRISKLNHINSFTYVLHKSSITWDSLFLSYRFLGF